MAKEVPLDRRREAVAKRESGESRASVAKFIGCSERSVTRYTTQSSANNGDVSSKPRGGDTQSPDNLEELLALTKEMLDGEVKVGWQDVADVWALNGAPRTRHAVEKCAKKHGLYLSNSRQRGAKASTVKPVKKRRYVKCKGFLKEKDREKLKEILRQKGIHHKVRDRCRIFQAIDKGQPVKEVAQAYGISSQAIYRMKSNYHNGGLDKVMHLGYEGRKNHSKLSPEQMKKLDSYIDGDLTVNLRTAQAWIYKEFGVEYKSLSGVRGLFTRLDRTCRRPKKQPKLPPFEEQEEWLKNFGETMENAPEGSVLLYFDAAHPYDQPDTGHCWPKKGEDIALPQKSGRQRLNILAALNIENGQMTYLEEKTINKEAVIRLFEKIIQDYLDASKIYIVLDNAGYNKATEVMEWLENQPDDGPEIELIFLLPYCPHFNAIERLWKKMRDKVTRFRLYKNKRDFRKAIMDFLDSVQELWEEYRTYVAAKTSSKNPKNHRIVIRNPECVEQGAISVAVKASTP